VALPFPVKLVPESCIGVPSGPEPGLNPVIVGAGPPPVTVRLIFAVCVKLPDVPVTVTGTVPVVAEPLAVSVKVLVLVVFCGLNAAVTPLGRPEAVKLALPVKPPTSATVIVLAPLFPWATLKTLGKTDSVKPLPEPVPASGMSSGFGLALLATVSAPTEDPTAVGEN
jgi:hypothetical protein